VRIAKIDKLNIVHAVKESPLSRQLSEEETANFDIPTGQPRIRYGRNDRQSELIYLYDGLAKIDFELDTLAIMYDEGVK
jgi:hypothetical protein